MSEQGGGAPTGWQQFKVFLIHLVFDTLKNLAILAALSTIFLAAELLRVIGMDPVEVKRIEDLHFWLTYAALLWIGFVFLVKLVRGSIK
jgi:hypothetical protein